MTGEGAIATRLIVLLFGGLVWAGTSCTVDEAVNPAAKCVEGVNDCAPGRICYRGFCVIDDGDATLDAGHGGDDGSPPAHADGATRDPDSGPPPDGSSVTEDGGSVTEDGGFVTPEDGGAGGCASGETLSCYEGPDGTLGRGLCEAGERECAGGTFGVCVGQVLPADEACNDDDDDCDGHTDEGIDLDSDPDNCGACGVECSFPMDNCCSGRCRPNCRGD